MHGSEQHGCRGGQRHRGVDGHRRPVGGDGPRGGGDRHRADERDGDEHAFPRPPVGELRGDRGDDGGRKHPHQRHDPDLGGPATLVRVDRRDDRDGPLRGPRTEERELGATQLDVSPVVREGGPRRLHRGGRRSRGRRARHLRSLTGRMAACGRDSPSQPGRITPRGDPARATRHLASPPGGPSLPDRGASHDVSQSPSPTLLPVERRRLAPGWRARRRRRRLCSCSTSSRH